MSTAQLESKLVLGPELAGTLMTPEEFDAVEEYDDLHRTRGSRRRADRVIWAGLGRQPDPRRDMPTIVVEFVSAAKADRQRDYVDKRQEYEEAGVAEYWIIDRFRRTLTVLQNRPSGPGEQVIGEHETYRTPLLPGFDLPLGRLLVVAARWRASE